MKKIFVLIFIMLIVCWGEERTKESLPYILKEETREYTQAETGPGGKTVCTYGKYEIVILEYHFKCYLAVSREGKIIHTEDACHLYLGSMEKEHKKRINEDITGDGLPNLVVYEWSGGAHCAFIAHVFITADKFRKQYEINGDHGIPEFKDLNKDGYPEVLIYDWTFAYWNTCFADSPAPKVIMKPKKGVYKFAFELMKENPPLEKEVIKKIEEVHSKTEWKKLTPEKGYPKHYVY